jgi:hypothetical protein
MIRIPTTLHLGREDKGEEVEVLQAYLKTYGYIMDKKEDFGVEIDIEDTVKEPKPGEFDDRTEKALRHFQEFNQLPVTGYLNQQTIRQYMQPRCGNLDLIKELPESIATEKKWHKTNIVYEFKSFTSNLTMLFLNWLYYG